MTARRLPPPTADERERARVAAAALRAAIADPSKKGEPTTFHADFSRPRAEMIPDLEALAEKGERPTTATTPGSSPGPARAAADPAADRRLV